MNIYLKWTNQLLTENSDISLFNLEISQVENYFTKARLLIDALTPLPPTETEGIIWEEENILFKGYLVGTFVKCEGDLGEIELIAKPLDFSVKISALQKESRIPPYWDSLWVHPSKLSHFEEIQDVTTKSLYCDARTGELALSDWFEGKQHVDGTQKYFPQSLSTKIVGMPLKSCTVNVHAHWVQWMHGIANLSPHIRRAFPHRKVNSYAEKALLEKWPKPRKRLGRSGLWILKSKLKPVTPPSYLYPAYSPPLLFADKEGAPLKTYRLKRYWFKPSFWVRWQIRQKRKETLTLTLTHNFQPLFPGEAKHKILEFTLQNINPDPGVQAWQPKYFYRKDSKICYQNAIYKCKIDHSSALTFEDNRDLWSLKKYFHTPLGNPARASFFLTDRGRLAAEHAMERAKAILAHSARCIEVFFEGPWNDLKEITTDTSLTLADPRLPGGQVKGKVVKHLLRATGETGERIAQVTLLCAVGAKTPPPDPASAKPTYSIEGYDDESYQVYENKICKTPSGLSYFTYDHNQPENMFPGSLLRGIQLINGPDDQEAEMLRHTSPKTLKKSLSGKATRLKFFFKDLRTKERLDHLIPVIMAAPWSAPRQVHVLKYTHWT